MNSLTQPKLNDLSVAYGVISGFPMHDSYSVEDREKLDKLFREDYFAWEAMSKAAISRFKTNRSDAEAPVGPTPFSHYRVKDADSDYLFDNFSQCPCLSFNGFSRGRSLGR